jgi:hypothetical protein
VDDARVFTSRFFFLALTVLIGLAGCNRGFRKPLVSVLNTADPSTAKQLVGGFYPVEAKSWRWTARRFIVKLSPPPGSDRKGAKLQLHLFIPQDEIARLGPMTLSADVTPSAEADDYTLPPETYSKGGMYSYIRDVPANLLRTNMIPIIFTFDKAQPPAAVDGRELGAVVSLIGLNTN